MWVKAGPKQEVTGQQYLLTCAPNPAKVSSVTTEGLSSLLCARKATSDAHLAAVGDSGLISCLSFICHGTQSAPKSMA